MYCYRISNDLPSFLNLTVSAWQIQKFTLDGGVIDHSSPLLSLSHDVNRFT